MPEENKSQQNTPPEATAQNEQPTQPGETPSPPATGEQPAETPAGGIEIEFDDGQKEVLTPERIQQLLDGEKEKAQLLTKLGHMSNEIGDLRKKVSGTATPQPTSPDTAFTPEIRPEDLGLSDEDLEDPKKVFVATQKLIARAQERTNRQIESERIASYLISSVDRLKTMPATYDQKIDIINTAVRMANNSGFGINTHEEALNYYFSVVDGKPYVPAGQSFAAPPAAPQTPPTQEGVQQPVQTTKTTRVIQNLQRASNAPPPSVPGNGVPPPQSRAEQYMAMSREEGREWYKREILAKGQAEVRAFADELNAIATAPKAV